MLDSWRRYRVWPEMARELVARDVTRVKRHALGLCLLDGFEDGLEPEFIPCDEPRLNVLAVIGPARKGGFRFEEALLLELGLHRTRPYRKAEGAALTKQELRLRRKNRNRFRSGRHVPMRRKWFTLTKQQYLAVAPHLFRFLQEHVDERVGRWEITQKFEPFWRKVPRYIVGRHGQIHYTEIAAHHERGIRFSVSTADRSLISDIYWAELWWNARLMYQLLGLARFISLCLRDHRYTRLPGDGFLGFWQLPAIERVRAALKRAMQRRGAGRLPRYLLAEMIRRFLPPDSRRFRDVLAQMIGWNGKETWEYKTAARALPNPESRIGYIRIRVIARRRRYIVFEVFSRLPNPSATPSLSS